MFSFKIIQIHRSPSPKPGSINKNFQHIINFPVLNFRVLFFSYSRLCVYLIDRLETTCTLYNTPAGAGRCTGWIHRLLYTHTRRKSKTLCKLMEISNICVQDVKDSPRERRIFLCASVTERENGTVSTGERKRREMERIECVLPWLRT
jgi:hypothetical protein